ncbi:amidase, partial [Streptococcus sobrinus]|uniref:amidase n=1 Tax=Streptococcus sobrinus TaxID=1310 RepID=UPI000368C2EE
MKAFQDATAMVAALRAKQVSPSELVEASIAQIKRLNPQINALVSQQFEQALREAKERLFSDQPFAGVPLLLKDLGQKEAGVPSTFGSTLFRDHKAALSDTYVQRLKALGFIIMGRTNTPEFGLKNISDARLHGPVNLPDDLSRNAGGSSGGAAAAVSSGMVPLAAASDGGGSIRIPASFNGLIGLKPSRGRIPVGPVDFRHWQGAAVQFALTKTVRDTKRLLYYLQDYQLESPFPLAKLTHSALEVKEPPSLSIALIVKSPIASPVSQEAICAVEKTAKILEQLGHRVEFIDQVPIDGIEAMKSYYIMNSVETATMFKGIEAQLGRSLTAEDMEPMTWALFRAGLKLPAYLYSKTLSQWDSYTYQMHRFHQKYDLLLSPTTADVAPKQGQLALPLRLQESLIAMDQFEQWEQ